MTTIGEKIRLRRKELKLTLVQLSEAVGCNQGYLSLVETGKRNASIRLLERLEFALKLPMGFLRPPSFYGVLAKTKVNRRLILVVTTEQTEDAKGVLSKIAQEMPLHFYFFGGYAWEIEVPGIKDMWNKLTFLIQVEEETIGLLQFDLNRQTLIATMICAVLPEHRKQGHALYAVTKGIRYVFKQLGFRKIETGVHAENTESVRFNQKMMTLEGTLRGHMPTNHPNKFADRFLYGLTRKEFSEKEKG